MKRRIYKHTIQVTVLSNYSNPASVFGKDWGLADVAHEIDEGDAIGSTEVTKTEKIEGAVAIRKELLAIGNDGSFFDSI